MPQTLHSPANFSFRQQLGRLLKPVDSHVTVRLPEDKRMTNYGVIWRDADPRDQQPPEMPSNDIWGRNR